MTREHSVVLGAHDLEKLHEVKAGRAGLGLEAFWGRIKGLGFRILLSAVRISETEVPASGVSEMIFQLPSLRVCD